MTSDTNTHSTCNGIVEELTDLSRQDEVISVVERTPEGR